MAGKPFEIIVEPRAPLSFEEAARHYGLKKAEADAVRAAVLRVVFTKTRGRVGSLPKRKLGTRKK